MNKIALLLISLVINTTCIAQTFINPEVIDGIKCNDFYAVDANWVDGFEQNLIITLTNTTNERKEFDILLTAKPYDNESEEFIKLGSKTQIELQPLQQINIKGKIKLSNLNQKKLYAVIAKKSENNPEEKNIIGTLATINHDIYEDKDWDFDCRLSCPLLKEVNGENILDSDNLLIDAQVVSHEPSIIDTSHFRLHVYREPEKIEETRTLINEGLLGIGLDAEAEVGTSYFMKNIHNITFTPGHYSIELVFATNTGYHMMAGPIFFTMVDSTDSVRPLNSNDNETEIYDINGILLGNKGNLSSSSLPHGIYVVKGNNQTKKMIKY